MIPVGYSVVTQTICRDSQTFDWTSLNSRINWISSIHPQAFLNPTQANCKLFFLVKWIQTTACTCVIINITNSGSDYRGCLIATFAIITAFEAYSAYAAAEKATWNKWKIMLRCRTHSKIISLKVTQHKKLSITKGGKNRAKGREKAFVEFYVYGVVQAGFGRRREWIGSEWKNNRRGKSETWKYHKNYLFFGCDCCFFSLHNMTRVCSRHFHFTESIHSSSVYFTCLKPEVVAQEREERRKKINEILIRKLLFNIKHTLWGRFWIELMKSFFRCRIRRRAGGER